MTTLVRFLFVCLFVLVVDLSNIVEVGQLENMLRAFCFINYLYSTITFRGVKHEMGRNWVEGLWSFGFMLTG